MEAAGEYLIQYDQVGEQFGGVHRKAHGVCGTEPTTDRKPWNILNQIQNCYLVIERRQRQDPEIRTLKSFWRNLGNLRLRN